MVNFELYTNSKTKNDCFRHEFYNHKDYNVDIAVAFFSSSDLVNELLKNQCRIRLIIRLAPGTNPINLREIINKPGLEIRYYTGKNFHPKLYVFQDKIIIGSSNLTKGGTLYNQEINISIDRNDKRFDKLKNLFNSYWDEAIPLNTEILDEYIRIINEYNEKIKNIENEFDIEINDYIPQKEYSDSLKKAEITNYFSPEVEKYFSKEYDSFLKQHEILEEIYKDTNLRLFKENELPLRLEIDQFISWVKEKKYSQDKDFDPRVLHIKNVREIIPPLMREFINSDYNRKIWEVNNFNKISSNFKNKETIAQLTYEKLFDTLLIINAFREHMERFVKNAQEKFFVMNKENNVKNKISTLLFGKDDFRLRLVHAINKSPKVSHMNQSSYKELLGWVNRENIPICNDRTLKTMNWLGFNITCPRK